VIDRLAPSHEPVIEFRTTVPSMARCLGVAASAVVAEGDSGVVVLTSLGLFRFRQETAIRSGIIHHSARLARAAADNSLWIASGCHLLRLDAGEADARVVLRLAEPIDDLSSSNTNRPEILVRTGATLRDYDTSDTAPRLRWIREMSGIKADSLALLGDGTIAVGVDGETPQILILDPTGKTTRSIELPGSCQNLLPLGNDLVAKLDVAGVTSAYQIDLARGSVEILPGPGELVALAVDSSDSNSIIGLFISGEIVRWNSTSEPQTLGRFPEDEGPFLGLAVSGELLWGLSARNDSTWLIVRPMNPLD
jgi:hypothetical protein